MSEEAGISVSDDMAALRQRDSEAARALEFLALTACRPGEVVGARWSEIDLAERVREAIGWLKSRRTAA